MYFQKVLKKYHIRIFGTWNESSCLEKEMTVTKENSNDRHQTGRVGF